MPKPFEKFDPARDYAVAASFLRIKGTVHRKGDKVQRYDGDDRVLARLYDQRKIVLADGDAPDPVSTSEDQRADAANAVQRQQDKGNVVDPDEAVVEANKDDPLDHDHDGQKGGSLSEDDEAAVQKLMNANTHDELFAKASGLAGVKKAMTKAEIATALVKAGRGPA